MDNLEVFERKKGNMLRDMIGKHITLSATDEKALVGLRDITSIIINKRVGEL